MASAGLIPLDRDDEKRNSILDSYNSIISSANIVQAQLVSQAHFESVVQVEGQCCSFHFVYHAPRLHDQLQAQQLFSLLHAALLHAAECHAAYDQRGPVAAAFLELQLLKPIEAPLHRTLKVLVCLPVCLPRLELRRWTAELMLWI